MRVSLILLALCCMLKVQAQTISLEGEWRYRLDAQDKGIKEQWFNQSFENKLKLPGTLDDAGVGDPATLTADSLNKETLLMLTRKHSYIGPAWYSREIMVPASWKGKRMDLFLERVIWKSQVWVDGKEASFTGESLSAPHIFPLHRLLTPGKKHKLVIRIDNRKLYDMSTRDMAHAYTNGTQIMWNGIIGQIKLIAKNQAYIHDVKAFPDVQKKTARIVVSLLNEMSTAASTRLKVKVSGKQFAFDKEMDVTIPPGGGLKELEVPMGNNVSLWDEFSPDLYKVSVQFNGGTASTAFGMRQLSNENGLLQINGRRIFLRGTLECNIFPLTGYPPMTKPGWIKVFSAAKAYGLNHLRFHSWCPPEAAFEVADSMGFYLQVELPFWNKNAGKDDPMDKWLAAEGQNIIVNYGNHPSFCFWSMGNELEGDFNWLAQLLTTLKKNDPRHLYTSTTFSFQKDHGRFPEPVDEFFITQYTKKGWVRGQGIFNTYAPNFSTDYTKAIDSIPVPIITHEIGQYSVYPNMQEIKKYTGVLDPLNFKAIQKDLQQKGLLPLSQQFLLASGKFAANLYKEEIERALKTKGLSGFQLLDLHDFPGQGTALIGILDAFWDSKGLVTAETHRTYCGPVVPLLRFDKAIYTSNEQFKGEVEVANFSRAVLKNSAINWMAKDASGKELAAGLIPAQDIEMGTGQSLGSFTFDLQKIKEATAVTIHLNGAGYRNQWTIWVYPEKLETGVIVKTLNEALPLLEAGRNVLLNPDTAALKGVEGRFAPVFWSPVHFPDQPGTMGILCDPQHPAFKDFPTEFYSNWQWWDLITSSKTMVIDPLPELTPLVRVIDNFFRNRKMANVIEAKVGKGKLILTSLDLTNKLEERPAARQLRYSLEQYMASKAFAPKVELSVAQLQALMK
ncbi:glycoside hydrolase family 2 [Chitinophaga niabensis]|uniref:Glycosyl hydrolases family 2, TIM barrel domain n=1 Tax=Chitinophaga niabensis TaxID=536979 RepID=A0A1N6DX75_9BACT|nr:glycoside hydrolase family 2 [Chitinophaga niabensis]SIN75351.1 Glycosyl hydrolases family 2, TIM barrel domain [Chitinophaga niabensis]